MVHRARALLHWFALTWLVPVVGRADTYEIDASHTAVQFRGPPHDDQQRARRVHQAHRQGVGDVANPTASVVEATIDTTSVDTRNAKP